MGAMRPHENKQYGIVLDNGTLERTRFAKMDIGV